MTGEVTEATVIVTTIRREGRGQTQDDLVRTLTEVWTHDGDLILRFDPLTNDVTFFDHAALLRARRTRA